MLIQGAKDNTHSMTGSTCKTCWKCIWPCRNGSSQMSLVLLCSILEELQTAYARTTADNVYASLKPPSEKEQQRSLALIGTTRVLMRTLLWRQSVRTCTAQWRGRRMSLRYYQVFSSCALCPDAYLFSADIRVTFPSLHVSICLLCVNTAWCHSSIWLHADQSNCSLLRCRRA